MTGGFLPDHTTTITITTLHHLTHNHSVTLLRGLLWAGWVMYVAGTLSSMLDSCV